jgi:fructokinase
MPNQTIVCFGEILWGLLPSGKIAGGAPMNVAYHAKIFGLQSQIISCVGLDDLGNDILSFLNDKGIPTNLVQRDYTLPTGTVNVKIDEIGTPTYEIIQPVSWDNIHPDESAKQAVKDAGTIVFGSLACRSERTRKTLIELLELAKVRVFDVNLRQPFFSKNLLATLLTVATIVKMNDEELEILSTWFDVRGNEEEKMNYLKKQFQLDALIVTKGANGAAFLNENNYYLHSGYEVQVQDTIGSGDAFLGAFLSKLLRNASAEECLETACAAGALVATKKGATPDYSHCETFKNFIK